MSRKLFVGGNWKMYGSKVSITELCNHFKTGQYSKETDIVIGCPSIYIEHARKHLPPNFAVAGQNCYKSNEGAFTGEISPKQLVDCGAKWVIIGHSERRQIFGESDKLIAEKTLLALDNSLGVILCAGETLEEREAGKTFEVVMRQIGAVVDHVPSDRWKNIVIAYEPVWAIGTGKVATKEQAQEVHAKLRKWLGGKLGNQSVRIIYGGSVNAENCKDLIKQADIDGFLVGGASLKPDFTKIINCA